MVRNVALASTISLASVGGSAAERVEVPLDRAYSAHDVDPARRFDFWVGEWDVNLRTFQNDLTWKDALAARARIYSILDGKAILELWDSTTIQGVSLSYYDAQSKSWKLWRDWPEAGRSRLSSWEGDFRHGRGVFRAVSSDASGGRVTRVHSVADVTPFSLRWDEVYSVDNGKTWTPSWITEFTRTAEEPRWPLRQGRVPTYFDGGRCDDERHRGYELLVGEWRSEGASFDIYPILDGCAVLGFLDEGGRETFVFVTFDGFEERWETAVLDGRPGAGLVRYFGKNAWYDVATEEGEELSWTVAGRPTITGDKGDRLIFRRGDRTVTLERIGGGLRRHASEDGVAESP